MNFIVLPHKGFDEMKGNRKSILTLLILLLFFCSCGMESTNNAAVSAKQVVEEPVTIESVAEEPEEMPAIVFMLEGKYYSYEDNNYLKYFVCFLDREGNVYLLQDSCVNDLTCMEIYDEFIEGKLDVVLTLDTTCEVDELRENYELIKGVSQNEKFELVPDQDYSLDEMVNMFKWIGFYYQEDGTLSFIYIREKGPGGVINYANDERANQIYEWLVSVSEVWK